MKQWSVASSIIEHHRYSDAPAGDEGAEHSAPIYLLVANRRRNGSIDWSPAGGVVDPGETALFALTREVTEETGLVVAGWGPKAYEVQVRFVDLDMHLTVVTHQATGWSGSVTIDDPDGIVEQVQWCDVEACEQLLGDAPVWVRDPFLGSIGRSFDEAQEPRRWMYDVRGERLADAEVVSVETPAS